MSLYTTSAGLVPSTLPVLVSSATAAVAILTAYTPSDPTDRGGITRATNLFLLLEAERWTKRDQQGDFVCDLNDKIDEAQAPLLDLLCDTSATDRPDIQTARVRCYRACSVGYDSHEMGDAALRLAEAMMRDIEAGEA